MKINLKSIGLAIVLLLAIVSKQTKKVKEENTKSIRAPRPTTQKDYTKANTERSESYSENQLPNGTSPYDQYFGRGLYSETENSLIVKASSQSDVVFILVDIYTGRRIRNEYIRKGTTFEFQKIPYGVYDYLYYSGNDWNPNLVNGSFRGGFNKNARFTKNSKSADRLEFERGYYGSYEITLYQVSNGNLETKNTTATEFFN